MKIEEQLKQLILNRYKTVKNFSTKTDIPYSTIDTILRRGVKTGTLSNVLKVCEALEISADALGEGRIETVKKYSSIDPNLLYLVDPKDNSLDLRAALNNFFNDIVKFENVVADGRPLLYSDIEYIRTSALRTITFIRDYDNMREKRLKNTHVKL